MIKNTHLYNIVFSRDDYMEVLMKLENHQDSIYPVKAKKVISNLDHATSMEDRNPYNWSRSWWGGLLGSLPQCRAPCEELRH